jgi:NADPH-dependent 2,4-dienoyl-CoA reductase/sulfur reductase-like enzyme
MVKAKHVVVIGGGPGGMEAARVAAVRGAKVTLIEKGSRLGGTMWFSQLTTPANQLLVDWFTHEIERLNVDVLLSTEATRDVIAALNADEVIVATGARRGLPNVPGAELSHVLTGDALRAVITGEKDSGNRSLSALGKVIVATGRTIGLLNSVDRIRSLSKTWMPVGKRVVVIGGGLVGLELAEFLAERGRKVTVLEEGPHMGLPMAMPRRWTAVIKATKHGVVLVRDASVVSIDKVSVRYRVGEDEFEARGDTVVVASQVEPDSKLADELSSLGIRIQVVGDALNVGYIEGAMHTAHEVAREL